MMFLTTLPVLVIVASVLLLSAGRLDLWAFWAYPAVLWLAFGTVWTLAPPGLVEERRRPPSDRDKRTRAIALPSLLLHLAIAGVDVGRTQWSSVPVVVQVVGFALVVVGFGLVGWTLLSNPYASTAVRIQDDRGQTVISTGPYALVRHPMYLGTYLFLAGSPLALASWWSVLPCLVIAPLFVMRTLKEDRMLHAELDGYAAYAARVRYRLVPGLF